MRALAVPQPLTWRVLGAAAALLTVLQLLFLHVILPGWLPHDLDRATGGLVRPTLVANLSMFVLVVVALLMGAARQRPADLGLRRRDLALAASVTATIWLALNGLEALDWLDRIARLPVDPAWAHPARRIGQWVAVTFGTALLEEVLFRGVLLRQLIRRLGAGVGGTLSALAVSQALFAAMHIPGLLVGLGTVPAGPMLDLFVAGLALALLYLASGNLALCIGLHGLADAPTLVVADRWNLLDSQAFVVTTALALAILFALRRR